MCVCIYVCVTAARSLLVSLHSDIVECPYGTPAVHLAGCDGYEEFPSDESSFLVTIISKLYI